MKTLILGGTGFIGTRLKNALLARGEKVIITTRTPSKYKNTEDLNYVEWNGYSSSTLSQMLPDVDTIVNLQGENIGNGRWTNTKKTLIMQSRIGAGEAICKALTLSSDKPKLLIQASATGFYHNYSSIENSPLCTETCPNGTGFLATVCRHWENSTKLVEDMGIRRCIIRTAPVLGKGGMQDKIIPIFNKYLGGIFGSGYQPFSWIHIDDHVLAMLFLMDNVQLQGIFNFSSPHPVAMQDFAYNLAHILDKTAFIRYPNFVMRLALGQMAEEMLLTGQKAYPEALLSHYFTFKHPFIDSALLIE